MTLEEQKVHYEKYLNTIVWFPSIQADKSIKYQYDTLKSVRIAEHINMILGYFENVKYPINCDILHKKEGDKVFPLKDIPS